MHLSWLLKPVKLWLPKPGHYTQRHKLQFCCLLVLSQALTPG